MSLWMANLKWLDDTMVIVHADKWHIHKPDSVLQNETQTDQQILARKLDLVLIYKKKRTCLWRDFTISVKAKWWENAWFMPEAEKIVKHENGSDSNCSWCPWNSPQRPGKETGGNWRSEEEPWPSRQQHS